MKESEPKKKFYQNEEKNKEIKRAASLLNGTRVIENFQKSKFYPKSRNSTELAKTSLDNQKIGILSTTTDKTDKTKSDIIFKTVESSNLVTPTSVSGKSVNSAKLNDKKNKLETYTVPKSVARQPKFNLNDIKTNITLIEGENDRNNNNSNNNVIINKNHLISSSTNLNANIGTSKSSSIKVIVRFRPLNPVEKDFIENNVGFLTCQFPEEDKSSVIIRTDPKSNNSFTNPYRFDQVFQIDTPQHHIYDMIGRDTILDVCSGYNGTIFTYGQSGSGKTYTMYGSDIFDPTGKGLIPRIIDDLFRVIEESTEDSVFQLKFSIMQIYKEVIYDLLTGEKDLKIKESPTKGIYVEGLSEFYIDNTEKFLELLQISQEQRIVSGTKLNQYSSRSHTIFVLEVNQTMSKQNITKKGTLNLVDLAGTEKVSKTGAVGETLEEAKKINLSLSALGNVIHSLTSNSDHVPYRDSKLTRILQESLGGNYKTTLIVTCSPHSYHLEETISSLKFAQRAKTIKNKVKMNIKLSYEELQKIIGNLKLELEIANKEISCLKDLLKGSGNVNENIMTLIESQNVKQIIENQIINSDNKIIDAENYEMNVGNANNINIINNMSSPINIIMNSKEEIENTIKKLNLMNRRSSFLDSSVLNKFRNNNVNKTNDSIKNALNIEADSNSLGDDDSILKEISRDREELDKLKEKLQKKESSIRELEESLNRKEALLQESNKDLIVICRELYEKFDREIMLINRESIDSNSRENYNNTKSIFELNNLNINSLSTKTTKILDQFEDVMKLIFKELQIEFNPERKLEIKKLYNVEGLKNSLLKDSNNDFLRFIKEDFDLLNFFSVTKTPKEFLESVLIFLQYKLNSELYDNFILNVLTQNKSLNNQNMCLLKFVQELMNINQNLLNRIELRNINNINNSFHSSKMNKFKNENYSTNPIIIVNDKKANIKSEKDKLLIQNKIPKFITKKNISVIKEVTARRATIVPGIMQSLVNFQKQNADLIINFEHSKDSDDSEVKSSLDDSESKSFLFKTKDNKNAFSRSLENCSNQLNNLKDFILTNIKENQKVKSTFEQIKRDINSVVDEIQLKYNITIIPEKVKITNNEEITGIINNFENIKLTTPKGNINNKSSIDNKISNVKSGVMNVNFLKLEEINEKDELEFTNSYKKSGCKAGTEDENLNKSNRILEHQDSFTSNNNINNTILLNNLSINSVQKLFTKYISTGCATKKCDGLVFRRNKSKSFSIIYDVGINCENRTNSPNHKKVENIKGDCSISIMDEE